MSAADPRRPEQCERAEAEEGALLLPAPAAPGLDPDTHRLLKRHFLDEIADGTPAPYPTAVPRRRLMPVLAPAAGVCLLLVVVAAGLRALNTADGNQAEPPASPAAVRLLGRIALGADAAPAGAVRDDQYAYVKVTGHATALDGDTGATEPTDESGELWTSVDGSGRTLTRDRGGDRWDDAPGPGSLSSPTYRFLEALPTEPDALLARIRRESDPQYGPAVDSTVGVNQGAFVTIGELLRSGTAPPVNAAALYRAAALIPGVITVRDAVDATGRHGVAVARAHNGERIEWIFDEKTLRLLGERTVLLEDGAWGEAGTVVESIAFTADGISDRAGETPPEGRPAG
ncbi:CU044_5270 family protein [Actinacidiphila glaucinigra]|uniref:CU044_5270 family protein n=1 Tax=Actinacidiphila glaucinigra TaxID=235986 RepID=UPI002E355748|nr:CU044_5270 family protein [Actinacidiphila glaucinigra]